MKILHGCFFVTITMLFSACGGGGDQPNSPPSISIQYSPTSAQVGSGINDKGSGNMSVNFTSSADIVSLVVSDSFDGTLTFPVTGVSGERSGTINLQIGYPTSSVQTFRFTVWVIDAHGNSSNQMSGNIFITQ